MTTAWLAAYDQIDQRLVAKRFPPTSPWWRAELERFHESGRRRWVLRVGRRGGKSSTLCRAAVCQALAGDWTIPPGDTAVISFVSVDRAEAAQRLTTIAEILRALGVAFDETSDRVALQTHRGRVEFRVTTCSTRGVVGFTSIMVVADEMARWESRDEAANPAQAVMSSLRPTMATQPTAFEICSSSPWSLSDYHASLCDAGNDDHQVYSEAPTWIANPTITEARTHELEPDPRAWSREYGAQPGSVESGAFESAHVFEAFGIDAGEARGAAFVLIDASSLRNDDFAFAIAQPSVTGGIVVHQIGGFPASANLKIGEVVEQIASAARKHGARHVYADQREEMALQALFEREGFGFTAIAWTEPSKVDAVAVVRRLLATRKLSLPEHDRLKRELLELKETLRPSGSVAYRTGGRDYVSLLLTLGHAVHAGHVAAPEGMPGGLGIADLSASGWEQWLASGVADRFASETTIAGIEAERRERFALANGSTEWTPESPGF